MVRRHLKQTKYTDRSILCSFFKTKIKDRRTVNLKFSVKKYVDWKEVNIII